MSLIERNDLTVPEFLNVNFFKTALENDPTNRHVKIKKIIFTEGSRPGENFCSMIYRAKVVYTTENSAEKTISLITKSLLDNILAKHFQEIGVFSRETCVYVNALPKIRDFLKGEEFAPRFFYFTKDPIETIVLEDAGPLGYVLADRIKGLDEEHCALVFRKLAKFHAASMVLALKNPEICQQLSSDLLFRQDKEHNLGIAFERNLKDVQKFVAAWPGFEETARKLEKFIPTVQTNTSKWCGPIDGEIKMLLHSDLWTNNLLFKYDNGKLKDMYFLDFQTSVYCSPGVDITHFLYTSPQHHILEEKRDHMITEYYYKTLRSTLESLGYKPIPTLADILEEIDNREVCGFLWAAVLKLCMICMDKDTSSENSIDNMEDVEKGTRLRFIGMATERFEIMMKHVLRRLEKLGLLDM